MVENDSRKAGLPPLTKRHNPAKWVLAFYGREMSLDRFLKNLQAYGYAIKEFSPNSDIIYLESDPENQNEHYITNAFSEIMSEAMEQAEPPLDEVPDPPHKIRADALGRLALVLAQIETLRAESMHLVSKAREYGASWSDIGAVAGIPRQSAYKRFSEQGRKKHLEYERKRRAGT